MVDCVAMNVTPELGENHSSADRVLLEEIFPELSAAIADYRSFGLKLLWFILRFVELFEE